MKHYPNILDKYSDAKLRRLHEIVFPTEPPYPGSRYTLRRKLNTWLDKASLVEVLRAEAELAK